MQKVKSVREARALRRLVEFERGRCGQRLLREAAKAQGRVHLALPRRRRTSYSLFCTASCACSSGTERSSSSQGSSSSSRTVRSIAPLPTRKFTSFCWSRSQRSTRRHGRWPERTREARAGSRTRAIRAWVVGFRCRSFGFAAQGPGRDLRHAVGKPGPSSGSYLSVLAKDFVVKKMSPLQPSMVALNLYGMVSSGSGMKRGVSVSSYSPFGMLITEPQQSIL